ncbi:MAG: hypothetical protein AAF242_16635 [Bacteroidota bacterium]
MATLNKRLLYMLTLVPLLLLIPLIAMQFGDQVHWDIGDFLVMGALLTGLMLGIEFVLRRIKKQEYRALLIGAGILVFLLAWAELAVGIFL